MELQDALKQINADDTLKAKFYDDPEGSLAALGVDTTTLKIEKASSAGAGSLAASVCVSVGEFVGVSVG